MSADKTKKIDEKKLIKTDFSIANEKIDLNNQPRSTYDLKSIRRDIKRKMKPFRGK